MEPPRWPSTAYIFLFNLNSYFIISFIFMIKATFYSSSILVKVKWFPLLSFTIKMWKNRYKLYSFKHQTNSESFNSPSSLHRRGSWGPRVLNESHGWQKGGLPALIPGPLGLVFWFITLPKLFQSDDGRQQLESHCLWNVRVVIWWRSLKRDNDTFDPVSSCLWHIIPDSPQDTHIHYVNKAVMTEWTVPVFPLWRTPPLSLCS